MMNGASRRLRNCCMRSLKGASVTVLLLFAPLAAPAFTPSPFGGSPGQRGWDLETTGYPSDNVIPYVINPTRPSGSEFQLPGSTEDDIVKAIRNAFQVWENTSTSGLEFRYLGVDHAATFAVDGVLLVTMDFTDPRVSRSATSSSGSTPHRGSRA